MIERRSDNKIVWYLMTVGFSVIILGGGSWANHIETKVDTIASLEANVKYIQSDIADIKSIIKTAIKEK